ncbi:hypothetical protein [Streptomyces sp. C8S0]|uniref:hypothetical protein n=1 Tax=Streptomyces sp. C8S0 TaxID=2585716 RepID=UPI001D052494|nr:hypothetical protein [Streptomyces sp. C8S0]
MRLSSRAAGAVPTSSAAWVNISPLVWVAKGLWMTAWAPASWAMAARVCRKKGWVVRVDRAPRWSAVSGTLREAKPFSGIHSGTFSTAAAARPRARKSSERVRVEYSLGSFVPVG